MIKLYSVTLTAVWTTPRDMTVTWQIGGQRDTIDVTNAPFTTTLDATDGDTLKLRVDQRRGGGFVVCTIFVDGEMVDYVHRNDVSACDVRYIIPADENAVARRAYR